VHASLISACFLDHYSLTVHANISTCFHKPRPAVLSKGTAALLKYLRDRIPT